MSRRDVPGSRLDLAIWEENAIFLANSSTIGALPPTTVREKPAVRGL
jgi:hypothetical protein